MWTVDDLIVAPATVRNGGGRAIVRLAGVGLSALLEHLVEFERASCADPATGASRRGVLREISLAGGLTFGAMPIRIISWPDGCGPLGMAAAELHVPGSLPLVDAVVGRCIELGARLARGGEFSLRAFLAGRIDLMQAEAVIAVVDARSPEQLSQALDRLSGGLGRSLESERQRLLDIMADVEAVIDFGEEAVHPEVAGRLRHDLSVRLRAVHAEINRMRSQAAARASASADMMRVVLQGPPNIGKSSLFNALVRRSAALVSDSAGTTRDFLEVVVTADADARVEYVLVDVAGVGDAGDNGPKAAADGSADWAAIAHEQVARADVIIRCRKWLSAGDRATPSFDGQSIVIDVQTRCDRADGTPRGSACGEMEIEAGDEILTSSRTGLGVDRLRRVIEEAVAGVRRGTPAAILVAEGLIEASAAVEQALSVLTADGPASAPSMLNPDEDSWTTFDEAIVASHLCRAVESLGAVTGREVGSELLDRIFARHCIGK